MTYARLLRPLLAAAVLVSGVVSDSPARAADTISRPVLSDDFSGSRGAAPDSARWAVAGDARRAQLTGDGRLALATQIRTRKVIKQAYGRAEARIRMSRDGGAWRALGVLTEQGELPAGRVDVLADDDVGSGDFHTYVISWSPTSLVWSLDGREVLRFTPSVAGQPFLLTLNTGGSALVDHVRVSARVTVRATTWKTYVDYKPGKYVRYQGKIYRVREWHTSLPGWQPTLVPALFQKV